VEHLDRRTIPRDEAEELFAAFVPETDTRIARIVIVLLDSNRIPQD